MKAIVFGGSGFIGSYVADELTNRKFDVTIFDLKESLYCRENQKMIIGNILDVDLVLDSIKGFDIVYNFAGLADIDEAINNPIDTIKLNILGNANIMEACIQNMVKRFVFASSIYVFSKKGLFYGISKQSSERFVDAYLERFNLEYTIIRYGSLYGPRADHRNGIYRLLKQAIEKGRIVYRGDSEDTREYIHVRDAAALSVDILDDKYKNKHLILTGVEKYKYDELLKMISEIFENKIEVEYSCDNMDGHYTITPYAFHPTIGKKLVSNSYVDLGQGLLECIADIHNDVHGKSQDFNIRL